MKDKVSTSVYVTSNYAKFKKLKGNRDVTHSRKIVESIEVVGYVRSPILVNESFEIIDGQNRFDALCSLGLPIEYVVQEGIGLKECQLLNIGQSNWTDVDFIRSYAANGNENYARLLSTMQEYPSLSLTEILSVRNKVCFKFKDKIKDGYMAYPELSLTEKTKFCWLEGMYPLIKRSGFPKRTMVLLGVLSARGLIDENRMYEQFTTYGANERFMKVPAKYVINELQDLYNYNRKSKQYFVDKYEKTSAEYKPKNAVVLVSEDGTVEKKFNSQSDAAKWVGTNQSEISKSASGLRGPVKGYTIQRVQA